MFSPRVRVVFGILLLVFTLYFLFVMNWVSATLSFFGLLLTVTGYYTNGTIYLAFQELRKDNLKKAKELIDMTKSPQLLKRSNRAFYYFIKGATCYSTNEMTESKNHFTKALEIGMKTENLTAIAMLNLASIATMEKDWDHAKQYLEKIKPLQHAADLIPKIEELERKIKKKK